MNILIKIRNKVNYKPITNDEKENTKEDLVNKNQELEKQLKIYKQKYINLRKIYQKKLNNINTQLDTIVNLQESTN